MRKATGQWTQRITIGICMLALLSGSGGQLLAAVERPHTAQDPGLATPDAVTLYLTPVFRGTGPESISVASCQSQTATTADGALDISCPGAARRETSATSASSVEPSSVEPLADTAAVELARRFEYERFFSPAMLPPLAGSDTPLLAFDLSLWDGTQPVPNPTFNPPLVLTMHYAQADVPPGANERLLQVRWYDEDTGLWPFIPESDMVLRDTAGNRLRFRVRHLTPFALTTLPEAVVFLPLVKKHQAGGQTVAARLAPAGGEPLADREGNLATVARQAPGSYISGITLANPSQSSTSVSLAYHNQAGVTVNSVTSSVAAGTSQMVFPVDTPAGFDGSAVVSSDQPVLSFSHVYSTSITAAYGTDPNSQESQKYLPVITRASGGKTTSIHVQNIGTQATDVIVGYFGSTGSCGEFHQLVPPRGSVTFDQANPLPTANCLIPGFNGSASVFTSGQNIVATVIERGSGTLAAYGGFDDADANTIVNLPLVLQNQLTISDSVILAHNFSGSSASVTVEYFAASGGPGANCTQSGTIPASATRPFGGASFFAGNAACQAGNGWRGSARITGNRPLLVVATAGSSGDRALYNGFPATQGPANVILAPVYKNNFGFNTVLGVQNAGASNTTITCRFEGGATLTQNNVPPGRSLVANLGSSSDIPDGFAGAVTCSGSGSASLRGAALYYSANGKGLGGFNGYIQ